jgi:CheY-like chemotaxis protein
VENDPLSGLRVLVVEDHDDSRYVIVKTLEAAGASVCDVAGADPALVVIDAFAPDVLVSDINMPKHDGLWLIRELRCRRQYQSLPAVAVTARATAADRRVILAAGFNAHVPKPVDFDELITVIRHLVAPSPSRPAC